MSAKKKIVISYEPITNPNGSINVNASMLRVQMELEEYIDKRNRLMSSVADMVKTVFDASPGSKISPLSSFEFRVLQNVKFDSELFAEYKQALDEYIHNNSSSDRLENKMFCIERGRNGGIFRWSDKID